MERDIEKALIEQFSEEISKMIDKDIIDSIILEIETEKIVKATNRQIAIDNFLNEENKEFVTKEDIKNEGKEGKEGNN